MCPLCEERDVKEPWRTWAVHLPKCAFDANDVFTKDNWNCATMNRLRDITRAMETNHRYDDTYGSFGAVPYWFERDEDVEIGWIVMTWYKERGTTDMAAVMGDETFPVPLTMAFALEVIEYHLGISTEKE